MGRLLVMFFLLPWWVYIPGSIGVLWLGERVYELELETEAEKAAALEAPMPAAINLRDFDPDRDIHAAREVHVIGLIDHDLDYELVERTNGVPTTTRYLYMIFDADEFGSGVVRAALMLDKGEEARFMETKADEWAVGATSDYWVYDFNGFASSSATLGSMANDAIEEQGLTKAPDFFYIDPFFDGREAALTPHGVPDQTRRVGWMIAAAIALIGVAKRVMSVRARPARGAEEPVDLTGLGDGVSASTAYGAAPAYDPDPAHALGPDDDRATAAVPAFAIPDGVSDDSPLGRLARRRGAPPPRVAAPQAARDFDYDEDDPFGLSHVPAAASDDDPFAARPAAARVGAGAATATRASDRFAPVPEFDDVPAAGPERTSDVGFYAKLALAMLVVGALAYRPSLLNTALPFAAIGVFWLAGYLFFRRIRRGAQSLADQVGAATKRSRRAGGRADSGTQTVALGVGGHQVDLASPVQSTRRRERGVI